jgi:hypothetical protein
VGAGVTDGAGVDVDVGVAPFSFTQPLLRTMQITDIAINPVKSLRFSILRNPLSFN